MYVLLITALVCGSVGLLLLLTRFALTRKTARRMTAVASGVLLSIAVVVVGALAFAPQAVCEGLGGGWQGPESSCRSEWGGNGNNDPAP